MKFSNKNSQIIKGFLFIFIFLSFISFASAINEIEIKGRLLDQMTGEPVSNARLFSAYEFSPEEVITDSEGKFTVKISTDFIIKEGAEIGTKDTGGNWNFVKDCYNYARFSIYRDYELRKDGKIVNKYDLVFIKDVFDGEPILREIYEGEDLNFGDLLTYPMASISIKTDVPFYRATVLTKSKNSMEDLSGPGNYGYGREKSILYSLPLDYNVSIIFEDENSNQVAQSDYYSVPKEAFCNNVILDFNSEKNKSRWYIEPKGFFNKIIRWFRNLFN